MADTQAQLTMSHLWEPESLCLPLAWLSALHTKERHAKYPFQNKQKVKKVVYSGIQGALGSLAALVSRSLLLAAAGTLRPAIISAVVL